MQLKVKTLLSLHVIHHICKQFNLFSKRIVCKQYSNSLLCMVLYTRKSSFKYHATKYTLLFIPFSPSRFTFTPTRHSLFTPTCLTQCVLELFLFLLRFDATMSL